MDGSGFSRILTSRSPSVPFGTPGQGLSCFNLADQFIVSKYTMNYVGVGVRVRGNEVTSERRRVVRAGGGRSGLTDADSLLTRRSSIAHLVS